MNNFEIEKQLQHGGIQSQVFIGHYSGKLAVLKTSGRNLCHDDLVRLESAASPYRATLKESGLTIPNNLVCELIEDHIETVDEFVIGRPVETLKDLEVMVKELVRVAPSRVMIDAKPDNFILGDYTYYVDQFPPMLRDEQGLISPWVNEVYKRDRRMMSFNFGDLRGQLTRLLALEKISNPQRYTQVCELVTDLVDIPIQRDFVRNQVIHDMPLMTAFYAGRVEEAMAML